MCKKRNALDNAFSVFFSDFGLGQETVQIDNEDLTWTEVANTWYVEIRMVCDKTLYQA